MGNIRFETESGVLIVDDVNDNGRFDAGVDGLVGFRPANCNPSGSSDSCFLRPVTINDPLVREVRGMIGRPLGRISDMQAAAAYVNGIRGAERAIFDGDVSMARSCLLYAAESGCGDRERMVQTFHRIETMPLPERFAASATGPSYDSIGHAILTGLSDRVFHYENMRRLSEMLELGDSDRWNRLRDQAFLSAGREIWDMRDYRYCLEYLNSMLQMARDAGGISPEGMRELCAPAMELAESAYLRIVRDPRFASRDDVGTAQLLLSEASRACGDLPYPARTSSMDAPTFADQARLMAEELGALSRVLPQRRASHF